MTPRRPRPAGSPTLTDPLAALPPAWRADRLLLGDRDRWTVTGVLGDDRAILLRVRVGDRPGLVGAGDPVAARALLGSPDLGPASWLTLPRLGAGPAGVQGEPAHEGPRHSPDHDLDPPVRERLGMVPATSWDWLSTGTRPDGPADPRVERLDPSRDAGAIRECLAQANPGTRADPGDRHEAAWFGVVGGQGLVGVIGAGRRAGDPAAGGLSWHLHGLGVQPSQRGTGLGGALTAAATMAAFDGGADWVSLGMFASNQAARRVYLRIGFAVGGRFTSYRQGGSLPAVH